MTTIDEIAQAAVAGDALLLRSLAQEWLRNTPRFDAVARPRTAEGNVLAVAASLVEMFAERAGQAPPDWTRHVLPAAEPLFLLREAHTMKRLRQLCEDHAPPALRRRQVYAPPNFLEFA